MYFLIVLNFTRWYRKGRILIQRTRVTKIRKEQGRQGGRGNGEPQMLISLNYFARLFSFYLVRSCTSCFRSLETLKHGYQCHFFNPLILEDFSRFNIKAFLITATMYKGGTQTKMNKIARVKWQIWRYQDGRLFDFPGSENLEADIDITMPGPSPSKPAEEASKNPVELQSFE